MVTMAEHVHAISVEEWMMPNDHSSVKNNHAARELLLLNCGQGLCFELLMKAEFGAEGRNFGFELQNYWATSAEKNGTLRFQAGVDGHDDFDKTFDVLTDGKSHPIVGRHVLPTPLGRVDLKVTFTFTRLLGDVVVVAERSLVHPWPSPESLESLARH
ncbi:hypothetical protein [Pseudomonas kribbensis]|uniref:Uncharacterized protein n=1 Tax=Pseudomonas kribbensis TaxID=1628086 RepID=A0A4Y8VEX6_9PSED|nr:hypothetical protein [Pseudomonas kribbensis]TFH78264.1 hypothetical protein E4J90_22015 [Pseudomonas kribbensis]